MLCSFNAEYCIWCVWSVGVLFLASFTNVLGSELVCSITLICSVFQSLILWHCGFKERARAHSILPKDVVNLILNSCRNK